MNPEHGEDIIKMCTWGNHNIKIDNQLVFYTSWINAGIYHIQDLLDEQGKLCSNQFLQDKYNCEFNFFEYESLIHAIPAKWKSIITHDNQCIH